MKKEDNNYAPILTANTFLSFYFNEEKPVTNLDIQKISYIAYAHYLVIKKKRLIKEKFEAWSYGPVIPSLYYELKKYGATPIDRFIADSENGQEKEPLFVENKSVEQFLSFVYDAYKGYTPMDLVFLTHKKDGAWYKTIESPEKVISDKLIKEEYKDKDLSIKIGGDAAFWNAMQLSGT